MKPTVTALTMLVSDVALPLHNQIDILAKWDGASQAELSFESSFESPSESWFLSYNETKTTSQPLTSTDYPFRVLSQPQYPGGTNFLKGRIYDMALVPEPATFCSSAWTAWLSCENVRHKPHIQSIRKSRTDLAGPICPSAK